MSPRVIVLGVTGLVAVSALSAFSFTALGEYLNEDLADAIGQGDYELATTDGKSFTSASLTGEPSMVFFGFAHCPEVCPTTLGDIGLWQDILAEERKGPIRAFFITVDPERDSIEMLEDYVSWVPGVVGVSGTLKDTDAVIEAFRIFVRKIPLESGSYTMDHSASVLLFDENGSFVEAIRYQEDLENVLEALRRLHS